MGGFAGLSNRTDDGPTLHGRLKISKTLRSFKPIADALSRILILGSMPGPEALRRREYYGFPGNHFWIIMARLFETRVSTYPEKIELLKSQRIALWDVARSCTRQGAGDHTIRQVVPNDIPGLLRRYPAIETVFTNGRTAETLYKRFFKGKLHAVHHYLPSTSPAHASLSLERKLAKWAVIKRYLSNRNSWC